VTVEIPQYHELMWPALEAIRALGGSATIQEMDEWVIEKEHFPEEVQAIPHGDGRQTEIEYRLAWARTHLKGIVAIVNSKRGVWALTDRGRTISEQEVRADTRAWRAQFIRRHNERVRADEETGEIWSPTPLPVAESTSVLVRHGQGYSTFERNTHGLAHELTLFV